VALALLVRSRHVRTVAFVARGSREGSNEASRSRRRGPELTKDSGQHDTWNGHPVPLSASLSELAEVLAEPPPKCWPAFVALGRRAEDASLAMLVAEANGRDPYRRRAAIEAIGNHAKGAAAAEIVRDRLFDADGPVVRAAIAAAQRISDTGSHDRIADLLRDADTETRIAALLALAVLWLPVDFEHILAIAQGDADERVRREAGFTLRRHAGVEEWHRLADLWIASDLPRERVWACELVEGFGAIADDMALAARLTADEDGHVRRAADRAVRVLGARITPPED
jgi:hypothetical protein